MTETEYINLTDLQRVRNAITILRDLNKSSAIVPQEESTEVMTHLSKWADDLAGNIKILGK